jgi:putative ABC transport system substrate-binding protein
MRRREFIAGLGTAAAWPLATRAQQDERVRRIGWLSPGGENDPAGQSLNAAFLVGLRKLGWVDGRNIRIDHRFGGGDGSRIRILAAELVATAPELIVVSGTPATIAIQQSTHTIPIVFMNLSDPIALGLVTSIARPGGNITGFARHEESIAAKLLELLKQIAPRVTRVALVYDPANSNSPGYLAELEAAAPSLGVQVSGVALRDAVEIEPAIDAFTREPNGGLVVKASPMLNRERVRLLARATHRGLPAVYEYRYDVAAGASRPTELTPSNSIAPLRATSIASSRAKGRATCRFNFRLPAGADRGAAGKALGENKFSTVLRDERADGDAGHVLHGAGFDGRATDPAA